jgi:hypothetical protein
MKAVIRLAATMALPLGPAMSAPAQEVPVAVGMALTANYAFAGVPVTNAFRVAAERRPLTTDRP